MILLNPTASSAGRIPAKCLKNDYPAKKICKALGIGVLSVDESRGRGYVTVIEQARYTRRIPRVILEEKQKYAVAGAQHNNMSDFKCTVREIERLCRANPDGISIKELFAKDSYHWSSCKSARSCFISYVGGILKQFTITNGILKLIEQ